MEVMIILLVVLAEVSEDADARTSSSNDVEMSEKDDSSLVVWLLLWLERGRDDDIVVDSVWFLVVDSVWFLVVDTVWYGYCSVWFLGCTMVMLMLWANGILSVCWILVPFGCCEYSDIIYCCFSQKFAKGGVCRCF